MFVVPHSLRFGTCVVDLLAHEACWPSATQSLTSSEVKLLAYMSERPQQIVSRRELLTEVWGYAATVRSRTVDNTVARLRGKIEADPSDPSFLQTVRGRGYVLRLPKQAEPEPHEGLIGRSDLLATLHRRAGERLITLVGPPGVGKSSIAMEMLRRRHGWFVDLQGVDGDLHAANRLSEALGVPVPQDGSLTALAALVPDGVLVLDNAEDCVATVLGLVDALPEGVLVRVTSRVPLEHAQEALLPVPPLDESHARALLIRLLDTPGTDALHSVLGGLPLAIELAAALLAWVDADTLAADLAESLQVLSAGPGRHDSLESAIETSWVRLTDDQRLCLQTLSVVEGPLDTGLAAAALAGVAPSPVRAIDDLVRRALVVPQRDRQGRTRLRIPALIRQWVKARADAMGVVHRRMALHFVEIAPFDETVGVFDGDEQGPLRLRDVLECVSRTAVALLPDDPVLAVSLGVRAMALSRWFRTAADVLELTAVFAPHALHHPARGSMLSAQTHALRMTGRLGDALAVSGDTPLEQLHVGIAHVIVKFDQHEYAEALVLVRSQRAVAAELEQPVMVAMAHVGEAQVYRVQREFARADQHLRQAMKALWQLPFQRAVLGYLLASVLTGQERLDEAENTATDTVAYTERVGMTIFNLVNRVGLARLHELRGDHLACGTTYAALGDAFGKRGDRVSRIACLANAAGAFLVCGHAEQAAELSKSALRPPVPDVAAVHILRAIHGAILACLDRADEAQQLIDVASGPLEALEDPSDILAVARLHLRLARGEPIAAAQANKLKPSLLRTALLRRI